MKYKIFCILTAILFSYRSLPQQSREDTSFPVTQISERRSIFNITLLSFFTKIWSVDTMPHVSSPDNFCYQHGLPNNRFTDFATATTSEIKDLPPTFEILVAVAGQFDRRNRQGRRNCMNAIQNWYQENSMWSHLSKRERISNVLQLIEEQKERLENEMDVRFHRDFDISIAACINRTEDKHAFPETIDRLLCNKFCNHNPQGVPLSNMIASVERPGENCQILTSSGVEIPKTMSFGMGQIIGKTFWGWNNPPHDGYAAKSGLINTNEDPTTSQAFASLGDRPDIQMAMKLLHINDNLKINYSKALITSNCIDNNAPQWQKAVAYYNNHGKRCNQYVKKIKDCRKRCFDKNNINRDQTVSCLLQF